MSLENLMVSIKKSKKLFKNIKIRLRINLDSSRDDRIQPASLSPRRTVVTTADHASGYSIPCRRLRVIHGRFLFDNAGKGTHVATPRVAVSSRFSNFARAGTSSRVVQAASELSVASCQRGLVNPRGTTRVAIIYTRLNFILHLFSNHNASKHLQSLYEILHYLIKTYE
ncbi:hypothetical protein DY000_02031957 [Brassica cretica]|uniref:Uncharacterized protein n=1 Tax=Brassica cretica TaxID=69181 RepID=A0ABQ7DPH3_BRACR|nr:hypothetical protein DY000_02031957 [Brassica cretica]